MGEEPEKALPERSVAIPQLAWLVEQAPEQPASLGWEPLLDEPARLGAVPQVPTESPLVHLESALD